MLSNRFLLTGDWHCQKGIYTSILLNYLKYIQEYCSQENIKDVIIMGDVFEKSSSIKNESFIPLFQQLYAMKNSGINFIVIVGNHDAINKNNDSIIEVFSPIATVVKDLYEVDDMAFLSYTKEESMISKIDPEKIRYVFTHIPIANFSFDNAYHATEKHAFREELFEDFQFVFSGHFHRHQKRKNIIYTGSPFQMNFGEIGQEKGFIVFDKEREDWEFVEYNGPQYTKFHVSEYKNNDVKNKFVGVIVDTKIQNFVKLKRILFESGAIDVIPFFEKKQEDIEVSKHASDNTAIPDIVREYLNNIKKDGIDNSKLIDIFEKVLNEV
jgi:DNA repair exonuclease SbcCD nuclease subunit